MTKKAEQQTPPSPEKPTPSPAWERMLDKLLSAVGSILKTANNKFYDRGWHGEVLFIYGFFLSVFGFGLGGASGCADWVAFAVRGVMGAAMALSVVGILVCAALRARIQMIGRAPATQSPQSGP